ncbi:MAG: ATP-dependent sacrificial sulfur transferase LarE [Candidatus Omnitrophica bacterium]|nr:ATP-dependent sacrificial sulfur transferase LarE [Candidatus Omnitrophota bacterium]
MDKKLIRLKKILKELKSVVVAYSGGVDSSFLLKVAVDTLGRENVLAVTARSETYPYREFKEAKDLAQRIGARHKVINTSELKIKGFKKNPINRCYYCKKELFLKLKNIAKREKLNYCLDGTNYDDLKDQRFGRFAAQELDIRSPLLTARITKDEIRRFSKTLKLKTWNKPAFACLASRFPYRSKITKKGLSMVEKAEEFLRGFGIRQVRVRHYGEIGRIEVFPEDIKILLDPKNAKMISQKFKKLGFLYTMVDLEGYKTGSMAK